MTISKEHNYLHLVKEEVCHNQEIGTLYDSWEEGSDPAYKNKIGYENIESELGSDYSGHYYHIMTFHYKEQERDSQGSVVEEFVDRTVLHFLPCDFDDEKDTQESLTTKLNANRMHFINKDEIKYVGYDRSVS